MAFTFELYDINTSTYKIVNPVVNGAEITRKFDERRYQYRTEISGMLKFFGDDFEYIFNQIDNSYNLLEIPLKIYQNNQLIYVTNLKLEGKLDIDRQVIENEIYYNDNYYSIDKIYSKEYNLYDIIDIETFEMLCDTNIEQNPNLAVYTTSFNRCKKLTDIIIYIIENNSSINFDIFSWNNYITQLFLTLTADAKRNFIEPATYYEPIEPATITNISLEAIFNFIFDYFGMAWYIDSNNYFRLKYKIDLLKRINNQGTTTIHDLTNYFSTNWCNNQMKYDYTEAEKYNRIKRNWNYVDPKENWNLRKWYIGYDLVFPTNNNTNVKELTLNQFNIDINDLKNSYTKYDAAGNNEWSIIHGELLNSTIGFTWQNYDVSLFDYTNGVLTLDSFSPNLLQHCNTTVLATWKRGQRIRVEFDAIIQLGYFYMYFGEVANDITNELSSIFQILDGHNSFEFIALTDFININDDPQSYIQLIIRVDKLSSAILSNFQITKDVYYSPVKYSSAFPNISDYATNRNICIAEIDQYFENHQFNAKEISINNENISNEIPSGLRLPLRKFPLKIPCNNITDLQEYKSVKTNFGLCNWLSISQKLDEECAEIELIF